MRITLGAAAFALSCCIPAFASAQSPVADAFKDNAKHEGDHLMAAFDEIPADKFGYKPTPAQMTFGEIAIHLAQGNDYLCGAIGGMKAPTRAKLAPTDNKDALVAALKTSFAFCDQALANLDDSKLGEQIPFFGGKTKTRAGIMTITTGDWADHYSQVSNYLRLNGLLPPTAKKPAA
jgi:DinB superfamily